MTASAPYVGPRSFREDEADIFHGRFEEADRLVSLVIANRTVVLYAQSGAGKTSLINAGLIPTIKTDEDFRPIPNVRVTGPAERDATAAGDGTTAFEVNAALSLADSADIAADTLPDRPSLEQVVAPLCPGDGQSPLLLVFDQFEELFTSRPADWQDRDRFLDLLSDLLERYPDLRLLFSIREEWLADIDEGSWRFRDGMRARVRLHGLTPQQAKAAIREPVQKIAASVRFEETAADKLVHDLATETVEDGQGRIRRIAGRYVEPVQLQVVCTAVWRRRDPDQPAITETDLEAVGSVDQALADYYDECIAQAAVARYEDELFLRNWFEHQLITASGTRGLVHLSPTGAAGVPIDVVDTLQGLHIVKMERRSGARWVELSHDRLMEPIKAANARWREVHGADVSQQWVSTLERIRRIGTVRIGVTLTPPFCFEDDNGILTGESIVVPREIFKDLGVFRIEPVFSEFSKLGQGLDNGKFDVASAGIVVTEERRQRHRYSVPTLVGGFGFVVRAGNPKDLHSFEDVRDNPDAVLGFSVGTLEQDIAHSVGIPADRLVGFPRARMAVEALRTGRIHAFAMLQFDVPHYVARVGSDVVEAAEPFSDPILDGEAFRGECALMMRTSDEDLAQAVNAALRRFVGTARHAELVAPFGITREMLPDV